MFHFIVFGGGGNKVDFADCFHLTRQVYNLFQDFLNSIPYLLGWGGGVQCPLGAMTKKTDGQTGLLAVGCKVALVPRLSKQIDKQAGIASGTMIRTH